MKRERNRNPMQRATVSVRRIEARAQYASQGSGVDEEAHIRGEATSGALRQRRQRGVVERDKRVAARHGIRNVQSRTRQQHRQRARCVLRRPAATRHAAQHNTPVSSQTERPDDRIARQNAARQIDGREVDTKKKQNTHQSSSTASANEPSPARGRCMRGLANCIRSTARRTAAKAARTKH